MSEWTPERHAEVEAYCNAATEGPWVKDITDQRNMCVRLKDVVRFPIASIGSVHYTDGERDANANFIAHARTDLPDALAEIERLQKALVDLPTIYSKPCALCALKVPELVAEIEQLKAENLELKGRETGHRATFNALSAVCAERDELQRRLDGLVELTKAQRGMLTAVGGLGYEERYKAYYELSDAVIAVATEGGIIYGNS